MANKCNNCSCIYHRQCLPKSPTSELNSRLVCHLCKDKHKKRAVEESGTDKILADTGEDASFNTVADH